MKTLKRFKLTLSALTLIFLQVYSPVVTAAPLLCSEVFHTPIESVVSKAKTGAVSAVELNTAASAKIANIPEFEYIREQAEKRGLRVWLFGGTASSYLHYVKWDLQRQKGQKDLQADRFDYDFTNIFRSTQDLDIVIDASADKAREFQNVIAQKYPHFLGSKAAKWEVRTLRTRIGSPGQLGFKEALLGDEDFNNQNTDSNSLGMVEITRSKEPVIRDLRHWDSPTSPFLDDTLNDRISFFRSEKHFTTSRAKAGQNPEILSVIRLLVKAFQYELSFSDADFAQMKQIVDQFDPRDVRDQNALRRIEETARKLVMHATNIEYAMNRLDQLGLRKKLMAIGNKDQMDSASWWLNKEPLRSKPVGQGHGATAASLNIQVVAHETNSFLAYESITRSHSGEPNVLISRQNAVGEAAAYGNGFYTRMGKVGARGTGLTIRFTVDPQAREGTDFTRHGDYIVFQNKKALRVIQESLNFGLDDLMKMAESEEAPEVDQSDLALLEKLKRKLNASRINDELDKLLNSNSEQDHQRLVHILSAFQNSGAQKLVSADTFSQVVRNVYERTRQLSNSNNESDRAKYIATVGPILKTLESQRLVQSQDFIRYLENTGTSRGSSLSIRKLAAFELLLSSDNLDAGLDFKKFFSRNELSDVLNEIKQWQNSADGRKRKFAVALGQKWSEAIEKGDVKKLEALAGSELFDVNFKNVSGYSTLLLADYYGQKEVIRWLVANPNFDFNAKNAEGFNQIEQLKLLGKNDLALQIEQARPEVRSRDIHIKERNADGSPIMGFVKIHPRSFMMGDGNTKVLTSVTQDFEMASTQTTQTQWKVVVDLLNQNFPGEFRDLKDDPSGFKGGSRPVETVSFHDIELWTKGLNKLSQIDNPIVQQNLSQIFPGHRQGHQYRLPSEAERELVQRNQGLAEGGFSFGNSDATLGESAWHSGNSGNQTHPVGQRKPIMVNGHPIYDIQGNVWEWIQDWYGNLTGGKDPKGPATGSIRVFRGGSWDYDAQSLRAGDRNGWGPEYRNYDVGFRLVRTGP